MSVIKFIFVLLILIPVALFMLYLLNSLIGEIPSKEEYREEQRSSRSRGPKPQKQKKKRSQKRHTSRAEYERREPLEPFVSSRTPATLHRSRPMSEMHSGEMYGRPERPEGAERPERARKSKKSKKRRSKR